MTAMAIKQAHIKLIVTAEQQHTINTEIKPEVINDREINVR